jgi:hypothetical protein
MNQPCHIENIIAAKDKEKVKRNRLRLKVSIAAVKWLTLQACAFRGHDETAQSKNKGNFLEIVDLLAEFNPEIAKVVGGNAPYNCKYTSPEIQKELLSMFACKIRKHIREEIGDSKFSILVDETCDVSKREHATPVSMPYGKTEPWYVSILELTSEIYGSELHFMCFAKACPAQEFFSSSATATQGLFNKGAWVTWPVCGNFKQLGCIEKGRFMFLDLANFAGYRITI